MTKSLDCGCAFDGQRGGWLCRHLKNCNKLYGWNGSSAEASAGETYGSKGERLPHQNEPSAEARYLEIVAQMDQPALFTEFKRVYANFLYWADRCERRTKERDTAYHRGIEEAAKITDPRYWPTTDDVQTAMAEAHRKIRALTPPQEGS
jgi:hypothetical protein